MKVNPIFYELISKPLRKWLKESKYKNQKRLAAALEISPAEVSRYLNGHREPPGRVVDRLVQLGFAQKNFTEYYAKQFERPIPEHLSKEEIIKVMFQQQIIMNEWKTMYYKAAERVAKYNDDNSKSIEAISKLVTKCERLEKELKELRDITREKEIKKDLG